MLGKIVKVIVDRPMGSYHPEHKDMYYPINYGYVEGIIAPDGEEQDAYILGVDKPVKEFVGKIIAIVHRLDDIEDKWVVAPEIVSLTKEEIITATEQRCHYSCVYIGTFVSDVYFFYCMVSLNAANWLRMLAYFHKTPRHPA